MNAHELAEMLLELPPHRPVTIGGKAVVNVRETTIDPEQGVIAEITTMADEGRWV